MNAEPNFTYFTPAEMDLPDGMLDHQEEQFVFDMIRRRSWPGARERCAMLLLKFADRRITIDG
jgi:hypothetical protein